MCYFKISTLLSLALIMFVFSCVKSCFASVCNRKHYSCIQTDVTYVTAIAASCMLCLYVFSPNNIVLLDFI